MSPVQSSIVRYGSSSRLRISSAFRGQRFELVVRLLGRRELDQFDLVELVLADQAANVGAVGSRLAAKARRVGGIANRQLPAVENLLAVQVGQRHFGGGNEIEIPVAADLEEILLELRQVAGAAQRRARSRETAARPRCSRARAVWSSSMKLISARASRAPAPISTENLVPDIFVARSKSRIPSAGPRSQCAFGSKSKVRGSPCRRTSTLSAALAPTRHAGVRDVRQRHHQRRALRLDLIGLDLDLTDALRARLVGGEDAATRRAPGASRARLRRRRRSVRASALRAPGSAGAGAPRAWRAVRARRPHSRHAQSWRCGSRRSVHGANPGRAWL